MMSFFRRKDKSKKSDSNDSARQIQPRALKPESNRAQRSKVDEKILKNGPDEGFVWYEET